jgi:hypothetical protein
MVFRAARIWLDLMFIAIGAGLGLARRRISKNVVLLTLHLGERALLVFVTFGRGGDAVPSVAAFDTRVIPQVLAGGPSGSTAEGPRWPSLTAKSRASGEKIGRDFVSIGVYLLRETD